MDDKRLIIIAGPNGSGKSTITNQIINSPDFPENYLAPDEVVKWSEFSNIADMNQRYVAAMTFCQKVREYLLQQGLPLAFETVFSTVEKLQYLSNAKELGYTTNVIFVSTEDPQINIDRIADRVAHGGHDVATEAVIKRYNKVMGYLPTIFTLTDTLTVYDNSGSVPCAVLFKDGKNVYLLNMDNKCRWIDEHLLKSIVGNPNYEWFYLSNQESQVFINQNRHGNGSLGLMNIK